MSRITSVPRRIGGKVRGQFIAGLFLSIPLGVTVLALYWAFNAVDGFLRARILELSGYDIPGVGIVATLLLIYLVGVLASNVLGRRLIRYGESALAKIPVASYIYSGVRQIIQSFTSPDRTGFMQVVLVEFPRKGTRTIGFITNTLSDGSGKCLLNVFIPTSPNPTSGFLQIVQESDVIRTSMSVDDALKMVVSGGRVSPQEVSDKLFVNDKAG